MKYVSASGTYMLCHLTDDLETNISLVAVSMQMKKDLGIYVVVYYGIHGTQC